MKKIPWDVEEYVALMDVFYRTQNQDNSEMESQLLELSHALNVRADRLGIPHDEKFRNLNGMKIMYQNVVYIASDGERGMSSTSQGMRSVYEMSQKTPEVFNMLLTEFNRKYRSR